MYSFCILSQLEASGSARSDRRASGGSARGGTANGSARLAGTLANDGLADYRLADRNAGLANDRLADRNDRLAANRLAGKFLNANRRARSRSAGGFARSRSGFASGSARRGSGFTSGSARRRNVARGSARIARRSASEASS